MDGLHQTTSRRAMLETIGGALVIASLANSAGAATPPVTAQTVPYAGPDHGSLSTLTRLLAAAPRRRSFESVPLIVTNPGDWDHEAATLLLNYRYKSLQVWENSDLAGPWPGLMREAMNGQVFAHKNTEFLAVSATHGLAHLALFSQAAWNTYQLAQLTDGKFARNTLIVEAEGVSPADDLQNIAGFYGPTNNNILSLQRRGAVFLACHDSIHAIARRLRDLPAFSSTAADRIAAELTNSLIPGVVLVPSIVAFLVELQRAGFTYTKGG
jgi:intracellular sulfur oxidation DsrE/DsrF family protein